MKNRFLKFCRSWKEELWGIPVAFLIWYFLPVIYWFIEPEAGADSLGMIQAVTFPIFAFMVFSCIAWIAVRLTWPEVFRYLQTSFLTNLNILTPWEKVRFSVCVFFLYLFALVLLFLGQ